MSRTDTIIKGLRQVLDGDDTLTAWLEESLVRAGKRAENDLDPDLFGALEWPRNLEEYEEYLRRFQRWIPRQSDNPAWQGGPAHERYAQEVSDRLSHFFWLVDQQIDDRGAIGEDCGPFRDWLTEFAQQWGSFLDTPESFDRDILSSFLADAPEYRVEESMINGSPNMPSGWQTFNQFFARQLNGGLRPIADPTSNLVVTSPADCSFAHAYSIDADSNIPATAIKKNHKYGNIGQLIEGSEYADSFAGGTFVHYMLPPSAYHRFHLPVAGMVKEVFGISGKVFLQVDLQDHQLKAKDSATSGFEFSQNRGVVTLDTAASGMGDIGVVAVIPVGMAHVASVVLTAVAGTHMAKGDEFGYFQFGGSDIIILFQAGVDPEVDTNTDFRLVGTPVARCRALD
ncbi:phosphatidylserine decarboxylase [Skermania sp. ID1734]|uniref:phosphatidylserine decarboxylase n=1 Tax=Skermania sp. ID1734 TaxID=2597516 RepID=UPI00117E2325|nr:phosphatidylserine decarboxylase [Skermania sp. ID1734]TSE01530.1 phosphatidylserine decarboxylase [Skermania sp. ID1734]